MSLETYRRIREAVYADDPAYRPLPDGITEQLLNGGDMVVSPKKGEPAACCVVYPRGGTVGLFECLPHRPDSGVAVLLAACDRLAAAGIDRVVGPRENNLLTGLQLDRRDLPHLFMTHRTRPEYPAIFESAGFEENERLLTYVLRAETVPRFPIQRAGVQVRSFDRDRLDREIEIFHHIQNAAFGGGVRYESRSLEETSREVRSFLPFLDDDLALIAQAPGGEALGTFIALPDRDGWARVMTIATVKGKRGLGVGAVLASSMRDVLLSKGYHAALVSYVRAGNTAPQRLLTRRFPAEKGMTYAVYGKAL